MMEFRLVDFMFNIDIVGHDWFAESNGWMEQIWQLCDTDMIAVVNKQDILKIERIRNLPY